MPVPRSPSAARQDPQPQSPVTHCLLNVAILSRPLPSPSRAHLAFRGRRFLTAETPSSKAPEGPSCGPALAGKQTESGGARRRETNFLMLDGRVAKVPIREGPAARGPRRQRGAEQSRAAPGRAEQGCGKAERGDRTGSGLA